MTAVSHSVSNIKSQRRYVCDHGCCCCCYSVLKERDDDDDEHFVDVSDDDNDSTPTSDVTATAAAATTAERANDADTLSTTSSWVHRNNLTCMSHTQHFSRYN